MKNVILLHGTGDSPKLYWFPYVTSALRKKGYKVWAPILPNAQKPNLDNWLPFVLGNGVFSSKTILIGHSAGAQLILSILEHINVKVAQVVLVSGYAKPLAKKAGGKERGNFNWKKIRAHADNFVFINSDNDPWGCNDKQGRIMFNKLGGMLIIRHDGHMGSTTYKQSYKEFPLLVSLIA